jgi:GNAT superfamily N-acetyltransferase
MKTIYQNEHSSCSVGHSQAMPIGVFEVSNIYTLPEYQRQGYATALLELVCHDADIESAVLALIPRFDWLVKFYEKLGFTIIQKKPILMARPPKVFTVKLNTISSACNKVANSG